MIKFIFWFCIIGFVCGILAHIMLGLKIRGVCKRKNLPLCEKTISEEIFEFMRILLTSAIPIYNHFLFLCVIFYDAKKLETIAINKIKEHNE